MKLPFSILPQKALKNLSRPFLGVAEKVRIFFPYLELDLKQAQADFNSREYLAVSLVSTTLSFILLLIITTILTYLIGVKSFILISLFLATLISIFIFVQQTLYPKLYAARHVKGIDKNLLPALRTILIHTNSGIPLFDTIVSISQENYGEVSKEFRSILKKVNAGMPVVDAVEESASKNPSEYYRRSLWQLSNGMKAGSNINVVIQEIINNLSKEQVIQIEQYGSQLSPLAMFYMIMAVIMPALAMTLLIILSSFIALDPTIVKIAFFSLYAVILLFQIMFLGMIKTKRPNLIGF